MKLMKLDKYLPSRLLFFAVLNVCNFEPQPRSLLSISARYWSHRYRRRSRCLKSLMISSPWGVDDVTPWALGDPSVTYWTRDGAFVNFRGLDDVSPFFHLQRVPLLVIITERGV